MQKTALAHRPRVKFQLEAIDNLFHTVDPHAECTRLSARLCYIYALVLIGGLRYEEGAAIFSSDFQEFLNLVFNTEGFGAMMLPRSQRDEIRRAMKPCVHTLPLFEN